MRNPTRHRIAASVTLLWCLPLTTLADPPPGYYDSVDTTNAATLRATLHEVIDDHQRFPYTSGGTDTWDILNLTDEDPNSSTRILDVYKNASYAKQGGGNLLYNREHTWPKSYGFPVNTPGPYTDCHMLFLSDDGYNFARSNHPYRNCHAACNENPTNVNNGQGGGSGTYPGNSNWQTGSLTQGTWETWIGRRGDVARALFYMDVRYEGDASEPELILTDDNDLIVPTNGPIAYMGILSVLLEWHEQDPVDDVERDRNDVVFSFQANRNPFIDHPEWAECVFNDNCEFCPDPQCPADLDCDSDVDAADLAELLSSWGSCVGCPADFDEDGDVDAADLAQLLLTWGPCE